MDKEFTVKLPGQALNYIVGLLAEQPYKQAAGIIELITGQVRDSSNKKAEKRKKKAPPGKVEQVILQSTPQTEVLKTNTKAKEN